MARLWARTTTYESVSAGDELPILVKWETADTIRQFRRLVCEDGEGREDEQGDAHQHESSGLTMVSQALIAYVVELLEKGFPLAAIMAKGSSLALKAYGPVNPGDTISLSGMVTAKQREGEANSVYCLISVENQDNVLVAEATARIAL